MAATAEKERPATGQEEDDKNYQCIFKGLTKAQAKTLAEWYSGQGEQEADIWFEVNCEDPTPMVDKIEVMPEGDVLVTTK